MTAPAPISDWILEQFAKGELAPDEQNRIRRRVRSDLALARRVQALGASDEEILERYRAHVLVPRIRARVAERQHRTRVHMAWRGAPVFAVVALALVFFARPSTPSRLPKKESADTVRLKGSAPSLSVFRYAHGRAERLQPGAAIAPGEEVQLRYASAGKAYGAIVSIDGRGAVTLHWPMRADQSTRLGKGAVVLPRAFQLDDAPGFERFFFVTSDRPLSVEAVQAAVRELATRRDPHRAVPSLPAGLEQFSFLLIKEHS